MSVYRFPSAARCLILALLATLLAGCTSAREYIHNGFKVGHDYGTPAVPVEYDWIDSGDVRLRRESTDYASWWTHFNDPVMAELIRETYAQNLTLRVAGNRVLEARAALGIAVGNIFPQQQQAFADYQHNLRSARAVTIPSANRNFSNWAGGFNMAWELDIWGRFRRAVEAADADLDASVEDYDDVLVTLLADTAQAYVEFRTAQKRLELARANVALIKGSYDLADALFTNGRTSEIDVLQAQTILSGTEALIPLYETQERQAGNRLCILMGRPPEDLLPILQTAPIPRPAPSVVVGVPADLVRRRPDVRAAERRVAAQCARIGVAESEFYPHLSITGQVGVSAQQFGDLFRNGAGFGNVGPQFRWNILNYGRLMNNVKIQDARFQQAAFNYQNQVLVAQQEAEDALIGFLNSQERLAALEKGVGASEKSSNLVLNLYREGKSDYNRVFNIQTALVQQQDNAAAAAGDMAFQLVQFYRAMGGGWQVRLEHGGGDWCNDCCEKIPLGCEDLFCPKPCPVCPPGNLGLGCPNP